MLLRRIRTRYESRRIENCIMGMREWLLKCWTCSKSKCKAIRTLRNKNMILMFRRNQNVQICHLSRGSAMLNAKRCAFSIAAIPIDCIVGLRERLPRLYKHSQTVHGDSILGMWERLLKWIRGWFLNVNHTDSQLTESWFARRLSSICRIVFG